MSVADFKPQMVRKRRSAIAKVLQAGNGASAETGAGAGAPAIRSTHADAVNEPAEAEAIPETPEDTLEEADHAPTSDIDVELEYRAADASPRASFAPIPIISCN
jgi:hypothetical protein